MNTSLTSQSVLDLQDFSESISKIVGSRKQLSFQLGDLLVNEGALVLDGMQLDKLSTNKILADLKVKPDFLSLHKKMSEKDWETVSEKLKSVNASKAVYARTSGEENNVVTDLLVAHKKAPNGGIHVQEVFDMLIGALVSSSASDFVLKEKHFDQTKDLVTVTLLSDDSKYDMFGNGEDTWKIGRQVTWSNTGFNVSPFFERLVCANGNVGKQFGFSADVSKKKYNYGNIQAILEKEIINAADVHSAILTDAAKHLKRTNVSVKEILEYRNMFNEDEHEAILKKYFDLSYLSKAYKCDVEEMHNLWKSTADTNKNAYDFFNDLTYIASHPDKFTLTNDQRRALQIKASNLLFKKTLDLEFVAPKVKF